MSTEPRTILLIHGLWMTPRSWENFRKHYERQGYEVLVPAWPGMDGEVEELRRDSSKLAGLGVTEIADYYEKIIRFLDEPPILIGHSFGGLIVQILLDRGLGAAGIAIDSVAPQGATRQSALKIAGPVLLNPANYWRTVPLSFEQFQTAFANGMEETEARRAYQRYTVPGPGRPVFQTATANVTPFAATKVNFQNAQRAPLLLIAGSDDQQVPAVLNKENYQKYAGSAATTEFKEFSNRNHLIIAQRGWQEVADYALRWAEAQIGKPIPTMVA